MPDPREMLQHGMMVEWVAGQHWMMMITGLHDRRRRFLQFDPFSLSSPSDLTASDGFGVEESVVVAPAVPVVVAVAVDSAAEEIFIHVR